MTIRPNAAQRTQRGISLMGLIMVLAVLGLIAVLGMKVLPTYTEYQSIKKAIVSAKAAGGTNISEIRTSFNKQAEVGYIDSIAGKDLDISPTGEVSFAYPKKIPLVGPVSLLIEYAGSTDNSLGSKKPAPAP